MSKKTKRSISTFAILLAVMLLVSIATWLAAGKTYTGENGEMAEVVGASASDIFMGPVNGFADASDVITFVFCLGAFLAIVNATGALETGIHTLVRKLHGKELVLIWILMFLFSVGGTTYGMGEETVGFYILLAATMMAAGFDPIVGAATVLLGAGTGVLGSTINPFATGAAVAAATSVGVEVNMGTTYVIGIILWLSAYLLSVLFVTAYAKKVRANKGSILTAAQLDECQKAYGGKDVTTAKLTGRQKAVLWLFALSFVVMILGFIPWGSLSETMYNAFSSSTTWLTGACLGDWWFYDAATWFLLMGIIIGIVKSSDSDSSSSSGSGSGSSVVDFATQFVGNPYVWGGTSLTGGADCSGFTQSVYANFGVSLPRTSYEQQYAGTEVSYADAQPGDLICYGGHVAIYMGNGRIVHASNSVDGIKISDNAAYRTIVSVRRLV